MSHARRCIDRRRAVAVAVVLASLLAALPHRLSAADAPVSQPDASDEILRDRPFFLLRFNEQQATDVQSAVGDAGAAAAHKPGITIHGASLGAAGSPIKAQLPNSAIAFNGQGDVMVVQPSGDADQLEFSGAFTLELWVKPQAGGATYQTLVSKGTFGADGLVHGSLLYFGREMTPVQAGTVRFDPAGDARQAIDSNARLKPGEWAHLAVTYRPENGGELCLYVNGQLDAQRAGTITLPNCQGEPLTIGALAYDVGGQPWTNHFRGAIDDFVLYDRALPADRVRAHFTGPILSTPSFEADVLPILAEHCQGCHGADTREADLDLRSLAGMLRGGANGPAIQRGHPDASILLDLIGRGEMPPAGEKPLSGAQVALVSRWVEAGAPADESVAEQLPSSRVSQEDRRFWAFTRPVKAPLPPLRDGARVRTPLDAFLLARLEAQGLAFSPEADRTTLIRRAYFDLIGLPPTPAEVAAFAADSRPDAYEQLIDRLLESPHYGERWGRHWLDAAGYVDVRLHDGDGATIYVNEGIWRFRDYVVRSFNADKPFDRFITEQLAGDELVDWREASTYNAETLDLLTATGYLRSIEDPTSEPQYGIKERYDVLFEVMEMTSSSLLGLTMECCRCHNHKYDQAVHQRDYYRLMAAFEPALNVHEWKRPAERILPDVARPEKEAIDGQNAQLDRQLGELKGRADQLRGETRQRLFADRLAALPEPIRADVQAAVETAADQRSDVQKYLADKFAPALAISPEQIDAGLTDPQRASLTALQAEQDALQRQKRSYGSIQALWDGGVPPKSRILRRGNPLSPGTLVGAGVPLVLAADDQAAELDRPADAQGGVDRPPPGPGPLDHRSAKSVDRSGDRQSSLASSFRSRHRGHAGQFRPFRNSAHASGIARLAGGRLSGKRLEPQTPAPPTDDFDRLPPGVARRAGARGRGRRRSRKSLAVAGESAPARGRDHSRRAVGRRRAIGPRRWAARRPCLPRRPTACRRPTRRGAACICLPGASIRSNSWKSLIRRSCRSTACSVPRRPRCCKRLPCSTAASPSSRPGTLPIGRARPAPRTRPPRSTRPIVSPSAGRCARPSARSPSAF